MSDYTLIGGLRHPLDRMLSLYFYPGRWIVERVPGGRRLSAGRLHSLRGLLLRRLEPKWDEAAFATMLAQHAPLADYFRRIDGTVRSPDISVTPDSMELAATNISKMLGTSELPMPHMNRSLKPLEITRLRSSLELAKLVENAHREDYDVFGYDTMP